MQLLGLSADGAERIFQAALAHVESEDGYLGLEELRAWDAAMVASFSEVSQDGRVTLEEANAVLIETFGLELSLADVKRLGVNRDNDGDGRLTPTELFPGAINGPVDTTNVIEGNEDGAVSVAVSVAVFCSVFLLHVEMVMCVVYHV